MRREEPTSTAVLKRSIAIRGHKTSVSLENEFWEELRHKAKRQNISVSALVELIDRARNTDNLSSAIRIYIINDLRLRLNDQNSEAIQQHSVAYSDAAPNASDSRQLHTINGKADN